MKQQRFSNLNDYSRSIKNKINKKKLKNKDFSLICNDCNGGVILSDLGVRFNSPFVNLWIMPKDYLRMLSDLQNYLNEELEFINDETYSYPVGLLKDVHIYFQHYPSQKEAFEKWNIRKERIRYDNLFILFNDRNGCTLDDLLCFDSLPYKNKAVFLHKPIPAIKSGVFIRGFEEKESVGICLDFKGKWSGKRYLDDFKYIDWFNSNGL